MNSTGGYNPIKWDCSHQGCWNEACRPPIHYFHDCFPRKISMTDIDATVEVNGHFLLMDWKSHDGELSIGQRVYFQRLTAPHKNITCAIVLARKSAVDVEKVKIIYGGRVLEWEDCTFVDLHERVKAWATRVQMQMVEQVLR